MEKEQLNQLKHLLSQYNLNKIVETADGLKSFWLQFDPKSMHVIKESLREEQETVGIPVPELKIIGKELGKAARKDIDAYLPLLRLLWEKYGREGRVVATIPLGEMELISPDRMIPEIKNLCQTCLTWEDADRIAMDALEPIVRKNPQIWLEKLTPWIIDENMWVRRAAVIVVGRLPMKNPQWTKTCLSMVEPTLGDPETEVKKAVSFAIRLMVRGEIKAVHDFLSVQIPPKNNAAAWVLCDVMRSMTKSFLADFIDLLPLYEAWAEDAALLAKDKRSVVSVVDLLRKVA